MSRLLRACSRVYKRSTPMEKIADDFWNIRGSFRIFGLFDIGTHCSLVRLSSGSFVFLDSYTLPPQVLSSVHDLTDGGARVSAILNLHPFHTVHVRALHAAFPSAKLYGTARHRTLFPDLPWEPEHTDTPSLHAKFSPDLLFSVPAGTDFISANQHVHFSSVLAFHPSSRTIHATDTLGYTKFLDRLAFHPALSYALQPRPGAAQEFRAWAQNLTETWGRDARAVVTAHTWFLPAADTAPEGRSIWHRLVAALRSVEGTLQAHEKRHG